MPATPRRSATRRVDEDGGPVDDDPGAHDVVPHGRRWRAGREGAREDDRAGRGGVGCRGRGGPTPEEDVDRSRRRRLGEEEGASRRERVDDGVDEVGPRTTVEMVGGGWIDIDDGRGGAASRSRSESMERDDGVGGGYAGDAWDPHPVLHREGRRSGSARSVGGSGGKRWRKRGGRR